MQFRITCVDISLNVQICCWIGLKGSMIGLGNILCCWAPQLPSKKLLKSLNYHLCVFLSVCINLRNEWDEATEFL